MTRTLRDTQPGVQYTAPPVFYELERCFQRGVDSLDDLDPRPNKRVKVVRKPVPPVEDAQDDDEVDQLASSDDDDDEDWWLAQADLVKLDGGLLAHKQAPGKGGARGTKGGKATGPSAGNKGGSSGARSKKGRDRLTKLPREVIYTIFAHCPLASLLSLSRTSRALRAHLASDEADDLWADARDEVGLPELDEEDGWVWPEVGLAQLVYGKTCSSCGKHSTRWPDCFLRLRLCKSCKLKQIVRLDQLAKTHRELHPASKDCVIQSHQPPANPQHCVKTPYGLLSELDKHDDVLRVLQEQDDQADEVYYARAFERQHKHHGGGTKSRPIELDSEDDIEQSGYEVKPRRNAGEWGSRVRRYVGEMREKAEPLEQEGELLFAALTELYAAEDAEANRPDERSTARRSAIEKRVLAHDGPEDWCEADFTGSWLTAEVVNEGDERIDDADWESLLPKVLAVLKRARNKRLQASQRDAQLKRRELLRPYYYDMRQAQGTAMARVYTPLFADFLLFPSVRALWSPQDGVVDAATWAASREGVTEDLNEWRCELRLHALRLILQNTLDIPDDEELDPDADAYDTATYDDAFFDQLASSALLCGVDGCYQPARVKEGERHEARPTYFGTLTELLAHQHEAHDYLLPTAKELAAPASSPPTFRIALPLEVSNAVVALCDAIGLDWEDASLEDLDEAYAAALERRGAWVQWWNAPGKGKARGKKGKKDWRTTICRIKREVDKAAKARPPRVLDIPVIVFEPGKGGNTSDA